MIAVTFQHPTPYFDDSYAVNSVNNGPYGDAIMQELIPEIEKRFRVIREPYARILSGGSTGGWEAAALQIFHPDFFGGAWAYCPDSVTFMDVEGVNIYEDENAFYKIYDWRKVPTANSRMVNGQLVMTSQQRNYFELVNGTHGRSGEQIDIWSAVFGPIGKDGYFEPLFDKRTGVINKQVAAYWKEHYDLLYYLQKNWSTVGPKLVDKLFFYTGDVDTYYLNNSTQRAREVDEDHRRTRTTRGSSCTATTSRTAGAAEREMTSAISWSRRPIYQFKVRAVTSAGDGAFSALFETAATPTAAPTLATAPGTPTATAADASVALSWAAPSSMGNGTFTKWEVVKADGSAACTSTVLATRSCTATGLTNGTAYQFKVRAVTSAGDGAFSALSTAATPTAAPTLATAPGTPTATAADASVALSWAAPSSMGNGTFTKWEVVKADGSAACTSTVLATRSCTATGLTNGTAYQFKVRAVTSTGDGAFSALSTAATPTAAPTGAGAFTPVDPSRVADTRDGTGVPQARVNSNADLVVPVAGHAGVPSTGAGAVVLNVTRFSPEAAGCITAYPSGVSASLVAICVSRLV